MAEIDGETLDQVEPVFDPIVFQRETPDPKLEDHVLLEAELEE